MKNIHISTMAILFIAVIFAVAIANISQPNASAQGSSSVLQQQATPTPQAQDASVIGSTTGIIVMGFVISAIIAAPLLFRKKRRQV